MRIACIAGFFNPVKTSLEKNFPGRLDDHSVIWIPQVSNGELNQNMLKQALFDAVAKGATDILIVAFILRGSEYQRDVIASLVTEAKDRLPGLRVTVNAGFKNARETEGVLKLIRQFGPVHEKSYPETLSDLSDWLSVNHSERIILHARAIRGSSKSKFEDIRLIYQAIDLLGTEYHAMRVTSASDANFKRSVCNSRLAALGLELAPSISATRAGEEGEDYKVQYPPGSDKKHDLDFHLKKGSDRDQRYCLGIYFFWDDNAKKVVIGWLPSHLDTRAS
jgi:hypothetical protein